MAFNLPKHVAIIMDGNGRWAKLRNLPRYKGHEAGATAVRQAIEYAVEHQLEVLTLFALSVENRDNRPREEVEFLMALFLESLQSNTEELHEKNVRVRVIGNHAEFGETLREQIKLTEALTSNNTGLTLVLAINYSGRWDILQAIKKLTTQTELSLDTFSEADFRHYLCLSDLPEPDLLIRTSGELRISNFMLWQLAYAELFFSDVLWPDFNADAFKEAIESYVRRERRYGQTSEQVESIHA